MKTLYLFLFGIIASASPGVAQTTIFASQVGYDGKGPKFAVLRTDSENKAGTRFNIVDAVTLKSAFTGTLPASQALPDWMPGKYFQKIDFSTFSKTGKYKIEVNLDGATTVSESFQILPDALAELAMPSIVRYYNKQRANTPQELGADMKIKPKGSNKQVDMRGGWADASGDISKYFSHLAYANFMSPQQIPLVTWSLINTAETVPGTLNRLSIRDSMVNEALYGADYMMRALSEDDYFYMIIFSHFKKDPAARDIVGLLANSVTTEDYQSAFREGAGMAIASLARISRWNKTADFTPAQYLAGARRAFAHLLVNNNRYTDDGRDNIIDDYCALMAATELWIATDEAEYADQARKRAANLNSRMSPAGYFISDNGNRPFWHASDAGMPVIALARYLEKEKDESRRNAALNTIKRALDYNLAVTNNTANPFGYARQTFRFKDTLKDGFFIPHENETGWWWQGENARIASLASAAIVGGRLVYPAKDNWGVKPELAAYASQQLAWILGANPYNICFMYGFGKNNVPYMEAMFGHGSQKGGISNGITGKDGNADGSGIDFRLHANGNEWRWTEQWIPHSAWFLQAVSAMSAVGAHAK